jgi:hypothetical protein
MSKTPELQGAPSDHYGLPLMTYDLVVWLEEKGNTSVTLDFLIQRLDISDRRRLLKARYERALSKLEE